MDGLDRPPPPLTIGHRFFHISEPTDHFMKTKISTNFFLDRAVDSLQAADQRNR